MFLLCLGVQVQSAGGRTWLVESDPENPEDRIGAVVALASSGDSVLVGPGFYYEHIDLQEKTLTIIGTAGAGQTILDGSRPPHGLIGGIFSSEGIPGHLNIEGLTLQNGQGSGQWLKGGAVSYDHRGYGGAFRARDCAFVGNHVESPWGLGGGAIYATADEVSLERCRFHGNLVFQNGAVLHVVGFGSVVLSDCELDLDLRLGGTAIFADTGRIRIEDCAFRAEDTTQWHAAVFLTVFDAQILRNTMIYEGPSPDFQFLFATSWYPQYSARRLVVEDNVIWSKSSVPGAYYRVVDLIPGIADITLRRNTIIGNLKCEYYGGSPLIMEQNIVVGDALIGGPNGGCVCCNDFWQGTLDLPNQGTHVERNLSLDPMFCDLDGGDLRIARQSPCSGDSVPEGCGRMGALEEACDFWPIGTRATSWGRIKQMYIDGRR